MVGTSGHRRLNDIWYSAGGLTWKQVTTEAPWSVRNLSGCVVFDDMIWVMGRVNWESEEHKNDVWYSSDGIYWTLATDSPGWEPRALFSTLVFDGRMWILGGGIYHDRMVNHNDVWCSTDGVEWQLFTRSAAWEGRRFHESLVFDHAMWIFGGVVTEAANMNEVCYSFDGEQWQPANRSAPWGMRHEHLP